MKYLSLNLLLFLFVITTLGFSEKETTMSKKLCGATFYSYGDSPEINNITISNCLGSYQYYVCCGNGGYLGTWGGCMNFTITVVVDSEWSGGSASIGIRNSGGSVIQCQQYNFGQGTYVFNLTLNSCSSYDIFATFPGYTC